MSKEETTSKYFEAFTYGYIPAYGKYLMHKHENIVEICLVVKGVGVIRDSCGSEDTFTTGGRFIFPANTEHEIQNTSNTTNEFYFIRIQDK